MGDRQEEVNSSNRTKVGAGLKSISLLLEGRETPIIFACYLPQPLQLLALGLVQRIISWRVMNVHSRTALSWAAGWSELARYPFSSVAA